ncbi:hypothetical protein [Vibrio furnissii]|uniref:hypothetical protein n=1 Tax=Vibrio furnissii TaxID=29494 RepID=UPI00056EF4F4|nr:hypothetical protein [Vibrio furnissii]QDC93552.1 hypothetical protein FIU11_12895 [Vibrio furnissii]UON47819.1 hypothetical protein IUJ52_13380 [Vibrio furnissii]SUP46007.1 Uncharacterised protein [Vibrio furnissii]
MKEIDPWENNSVTSKNKIWFVIVLTVLTLYVVFGDKTQDETKNSDVAVKRNDSIKEQPSQSSIEQCRENISTATHYKKDRLGYIGVDKGNISMTYLNDFGKAYKFKCVGNSVKLYAEGSDSWIVM